MSLQRRKQASEQGGNGTRNPTDPLFAKDHPQLWQYLTQREWGDGQPRRTSTFTVFIDDGSWKVVLHDRDAGECLWAAAQTFRALTAAIEGALSSDTADWRRERNHGEQQAKRLKKS